MQKNKINYKKIFSNLQKNKYILVSAHTEEDIQNEESFISLRSALKSIAQKYQVPIIYSTHPRTQKFIDQRHFNFDALI